MEPILLILLLVVFLVLPVLSMRKQSKRLKEIKAFQDQLQPGMVVKMTCGIHGRVSHVGEATIDLEVSAGSVTTWDKNAVLELVDSVDGGSQQAEQLTRKSHEDIAEDSASDLDHLDSDGGFDERPQSER